MKRTSLITSICGGALILWVGLRFLASFGFATNLAGKVGVIGASDSDVALELAKGLIWDSFFGNVYNFLPLILGVALLILSLVLFLINKKHKNR